jgi:hypothetical protein
MSHITKTIEILNEEPWYKKEGLNVSNPVTSISLEHLKSAWKLVKEFDQLIAMYQRVDGLGFIVGAREERFNIFTSLNCTKPREGTPKYKNSVQVAMVYANEGWKDSGYTKLMYTEAAKVCILISDSTQYGRSKDLWKSLARDPHINVYIYDGMNKSITLYDSNNINENEIWGTEGKHVSRLLVGTDKVLN